MDQFPQMLYHMPGSEPIHGGHFATRIVKDEAERDAAIEEGWHETTPAAKEAHEAQQRGDVKVDDSKPPTRAELEQKATDLGIKFDGRTSAKKLTDLIAATLEQ
jgi:hypothetical protein